MPQGKFFAPIIEVRAAVEICVALVDTVGLHTDMIYRALVIILAKIGNTAGYRITDLVERA